ncbi:MAG: chemotaxis protein CheW [Bacillota bacterium]
MELNHAEDTAAALETRPDRYLKFFLDEQAYALALGYVQEIIGLRPITRLPKMENDILGVINLRGSIVPVIDTRQRLGMVDQKEASSSCIAVIAAMQMEVGLMIDRVDEVISIAEDQLLPSFAKGGDARMEQVIQAIAMTENGPVMLLCPDTLLH